MKIKEFIGLLNGWLGKFHQEEGLLYGDEKQIIKGITVCWMVTKKVIEFSVKKRNNLIISHEDIFFPPDYVFSAKRKGIVSSERISLLKKHKISVIRIHYLADRYCVLDDFAIVLSLGKPVVKRGPHRVYEIKEITLQKFASNVKRHLNLEKVRITGSPGWKVKRIGGLWGGLGLSINAVFIDEILRYNVDTVIAGEVDEYTMRALKDMNIGIVEVGHEISEETGLKHFTRDLQEKIKTIPVSYCSNDIPYTTF
ncbi:MAG: Nif3-like dinuclear metal center hexameric protein [Candidatus Omnitrophica bacterium]|nr:Nif3-like dinuclear metal center hexameric protein [Candidatus Omnitrophota bacterium]MCM8777237.1 Nif3-like dinuclear metal center hexameric protein [Candidatus Omnitrophota bacterium]